jgi:hypothetical protein
MYTAWSSETVTVTLGTTIGSPPPGFGLTFFIYSKARTFTRPDWE